MESTSGAGTRFDGVLGRNDAERELQAGVVMGPTWEDKKFGVKLYLADCLEVLPHLESVDAVVTDPPYGIGEHGGVFRGRKGGGVRVLPAMGWDKCRPTKQIFDMMLKAGNDAIIWGGNYFADFLPPSKGWLYWQKLMGGDFSDGELAWTSRNKALREFTKCPKGDRKSVV